MSYEPTIEDIAYLAENQPDKFSSPVQTLRSIRGALANGNDSVGQEAQAITVQAQYGNYLENGGQPLEESPIPSDSNDQEGEGGVDTPFADTCPQCIQDEGCCLRAGQVSDKEDASRKVEWPPVDGATTLLVVARPQGEEEGRLVANVEVNWEGEDRCLSGQANSPRIDASGLADGQRPITDKEAEVAVVYDQPVRLAEELNEFIPFDITLGFMAFEALIGRHLMGDQGGQATFQPQQCLPSRDTYTALSVIPYPYTKLEGDITLAVETVIMTSEVSAKVEARGELKGQYGRHELDWSNSAEAAGGSPRSVPRQNDAPGLIGVVIDTIQTINQYVSMGSSSGTVEYDRSSMGSGVIISKSLSFKPTGFELVPVAGSPDLQLNIGSLESTLGVGVTGRIDLIEVVSAVLLSPANVRLVQDARARMAAGENVNATIEGHLQLSAMGSLTHTVNGGGGNGVATYRIPASGEAAEASFNGISQQFTGELKILGLAELKLHMEGRVFILSAQVGARGSIHTSWTWEMRSRDGVREKRYIFEGVKVSGEAYAEVRYERGQGTGITIEAAENIADGRLESETQAPDLFARVGAAIESSNRKAANDIEGFNPNPRGEDGNGKTIWAPDPEEPEWEPF